MADVRRTRQSVSPDAGRQATRRQRLSVGKGKGKGGGGERGEGGGVRPLSRRSFLKSDDTARTPSPPPREDSPLLGNSGRPSKSLAARGFDDDREDEKKEAAVDWRDVEGMQAQQQRGMVNVPFWYIATLLP